MEEKGLGYILLTAGLVVMVICVGIIILMFTGNMKPFPVLNIPSPTFNTASFMPEIPGIPKAAGQEIQLIPTDAFNKVLNLGLSVFFLGFVMSFGFRVADLGVKLIRPIKIEAKQA
ncbi:MAG: hypothetical protein ACM3IJ_05470 [Candidatus Levyibacteriota bacterium]